MAARMYRMPGPQPQLEVCGASCCSSSRYLGYLLTSCCNDSVPKRQKDRDITDVADIYTASTKAEQTTNYTL